MNEPYYSDADVTLWHGECVQVMRGMDDNSVHAVCTDPPAGIGFMGRSWDHDKGGREQWVQWFAEVMNEALRITKPGGHAIVWALPRTAHWTACGLEDAGWIIRDRITHMFASGFPKSLDVSKAIDREAGAEREVVGKRTDGRYAAGFSERAKKALGGVVASENETGFSGEMGIITAPATDAARTWQGWGTALKPAAEDWWIARKPLTGTVASNVTRWGTGAINVDGCRVATNEEMSYSTSVVQGAVTFGTGTSEQNPAGRWPSNIVLSHAPSCADRCVDGCPVRELDRQSGVSQSPSTPVTQGARASGSGWDLACNDTHDGKGVGYADTGGSSRFFPTFRYEAKAPTLERPKIGNGPTSASAANRCASCGRQDLSGSRCACPDPQWVPRSGSETATAHPTVKPLSLMRFLVRLVTPPDGTILDPFAGSGTTLEAAMLEGFNSIGIEQDPDYLPLIAERIRRGKAQGHQPDLFGGAA